MNPISRAVLTIATGNPIYFEMALNLARSFFWWHRNSQIEFLLATDMDLPLPRELQQVKIIRLKPGQYGSGFSPKLYMNHFSTAEETLFVDADCLCAGNLEKVFAKFSGRNFSVIGREETEGELFGDIGTRCRAVGINWVPRFCGGMYYFKRGPVSTRIFKAAQELEKRYDELGMVRLRGQPNEEPLLGMAMAQVDEHPIPEDGSIKAEPMYFTGRTELNVFTGHAHLYNLKGKPRPYPAFKIPEEARPVVVHFNCSFAEIPPYTTEAIKLRRVMHDGWPVPIATFYVWLAHVVPIHLYWQIRDWLRPGFHLLFGHRKVAKSKRVLNIQN